MKLSKKYLKYSNNNEYAGKKTVLDTQDSKNIQGLNLKISQKSNKHNCTYGAFNKETFSDIKKEITDFSPKQRKIKEQYPQLNKEIINEIITTHENEKKSERKSSLSIKKRIKAEEMYSSNVFEDNQENLQEKFKLYAKKQIIEEEPVRTDINRGKHTVSSDMFKLSSNSDWKRINTELISNHENRSKEKPSYSTRLMKMKEQSSSHNDLSNYSKLTKRVKSITKDDEGVQFNDIKPFLQKGSKHSGKLKHTVSTLHDLEFYKNNFKERKIENMTYEIQKIKNFNDFDIREFKSMFAKNNIHVHNVNLSSAHVKNEGSVKFTVRKDSEQKNIYDHKINSILDNFKIKKDETNIRTLTNSSTPRKNSFTNSQITQLNLNKAKNENKYSQYFNCSTKNSDKSINENDYRMTKKTFSQKISLKNNKSVNSSSLINRYKNPTEKFMKLNN